MAKKITALQLNASNPTDLVTLAVGQPPVQLDGRIREDGVIVEIAHNTAGLSGIFLNQMISCYRVGLDSGVNIVIPSDEIKFIITTEDKVIGG